MLVHKVNKAQINSKTTHSLLSVWGKMANNGCKVLKKRGLIETGS